MKRLLMILAIIALASCGLLIPDPEPQPQPRPPEAPPPPQDVIDLTRDIYLAFHRGLTDMLIFDPPYWYDDDGAAFGYTNPDETFFITGQLDVKADGWRYLGRSEFTDYPIQGCTFSGGGFFTKWEYYDDTSELTTESIGALTEGCGYEAVDFFVHWHWSDADSYYDFHGSMTLDGEEYDVEDMGIF